MTAKTDRTNNMTEQNGGGRFILRLFVAGSTPRSMQAIRNIREICAEHLEGQYELEIIDIYQQPARAREGQIVAVPTLIKMLPLPLRKFIGDLSNKEKVIVGMDLKPER